MNQPLPALPPSYRDVAYVAQGAFGLVYRALGPDERPVAVKVLAPDRLGDPEALWRFTAEYRRLAALAHPAFPEALGEGLTLDGRPYYAMAFLPGTPLGAAGPLPPARARAVLGQVAEALRHLHGTGLVHGDLKADNLLLAAEDRVYVLDVGTAGPIGQRPDDVAGTLETMAPEVLRQEVLAPEADWYALGVVAYQLLTGRTPFVAGEGGPAALVRAQLFEAPPPLPGELVAQAPDLAAAVVALLAKEPERRAAQLGEVFSALGLVLPAGGLAPGLRSGGWVAIPALTDAWQRLGATGDAGASTLLIDGPEGAGKSRTLDALRLEARMAGRPWLAASGTGHGDTPGGVARVVLRQALSAAKAVAPPALEAWLAGRIPTEWLELEPRARKLTLQRLLADAWSAAADLLGSPVVGVDDWHTADASSRELLDALRRHPAGRRTRWILTSRPDDQTPEGAERLTLAAWSPAELAALATARLGAAPPQALTQALTVVGADRPGLVNALIDHWHASGALKGDTGGWRFAPEAAGSAADPWLQLWRAKLERLSAEARALAGVAALFRHVGAVPAALLGEAAGLSPDATQTALDSLAAQGLLLQTSEGVRLGAVPVAEELTATVAPTERGAIATHLARRLSGRDPSGMPTAESLEHLPFGRLMAAAHTAALGDDDTLAVALAAVAAGRALEHLANDTVIRLVDAVRPRLDATASRDAGALLLAASEAERLLDRMDDAAADFERVLAIDAGARTPGTTAQALLGLAKCCQLKGRYEDALGYAQRGQAAAESVGDQAQAARAANTTARIQLFMGAGYAAVVATCLRAAELAVAAGSPLQHAAALDLHGALLSQEDPARRDEALALIREAIAIAAGAGDTLAMVGALENLGNAYLSLGDLREAEVAFAQCAARCHESGVGTEALSADMNHAIVLAELGETARARALAADVARRAEGLGRRFIQAGALSAQALAAWRAGDFADAQATLDTALTLAQDIKNRMLEEHVRLYRLDAFLGAGDAASAREEAEHLAALLAQTDHAEGRERLACQRVELARQAGDPSGALTQATAVLAGPNKVLANAAGWSAGRVALALGDRPAAQAYFARCAAIARDWDSAWHLGAALTGLALATPSREQALTHASAALALDANPFAAAGAAALQASFGLLDDAGRAALDRLTDALAPLSVERREAVLLSHGLPSGRTLADWRRRAEATGGVAGSDAYATWLETLLEVSDERTIQQTLLAALMSLGAADRGYVLGYENGRLSRVVARGVDYEQEVSDGFSTSIAEEVLFSCEPLYLLDASADERWGAAASVQSLGLRTVIVVPYGTPRHTLGVVYMDRAAIDPVLAAADMRALTLLATAAAGRVIALRREMSLQSELAFERVVAAAAIALAHAASSRDRRAVLLDTALSLTGAERGLWLKHAPESGGWEPLATRDRTGGAPEFRPDAISRSVLGRAVTDGGPLCLVETEQPEGWTPGQSLLTLGIRMVWCLPTGLDSGEWLYLDTPRMDVLEPEQRLARVADLLGSLGGAVQASN